MEAGKDHGVTSYREEETCHRLLAWSSSCVLGSTASKEANKLSGKVRDRENKSDTRPMKDGTTEKTPNNRRPAVAPPQGDLYLSFCGRRPSPDPRSCARSANRFLGISVDQKPSWKLLIHDIHSKNFKMHCSPKSSKIHSILLGVHWSHQT